MPAEGFADFERYGDVSPTFNKGFTERGTSNPSLVSKTLKMNRLTLAHSNVFLIASILLLGTLIDAFVQQTPGVNGVQLSRFGDLLREHHIELTKPALLAALRTRILMCDFWQQ